MIQLTRIALITLLTLPLAAQSNNFGKIETLQFPEGRILADYQVADQNGDGLQDILLGLVSSEDGTERTLRLHRARKTGSRYVQKPDRALSSLPKDVVGFAFADFHSDPGLEVVLFSGRKVALWRPEAEGKESLSIIGTTELIWQIPRSGRLVSIEQLITDVDGDGKSDILLPESQGYRWLKGHSTKLVPHSFWLPPEPIDPADRGGILQRRNGRVKLSLPVGKKGKNKTKASAKGGPPGLSGGTPLLDLVERIPEPILVDFNADGRLDLLARNESRLNVWTQNTPGKFNEKPDQVIELPVVLDRARSTDLSYASHLADLDGDRRCDVIFLAGDQRSDSPRTQVLIHRQGGRRGAPGRLFDPKGIPEQLLILKGFATGSDCLDVDGDKKPDLVVGVLESPDASKKKAEVEYLVFRNEGGNFAKSPSLRFTSTLGGKKSQRRRLRATQRFFADVTKDGVRDFCVLDADRKLRVYLTRKDRKGGLSIYEKKPLFELQLEEDDTIEIPMIKRGTPPWLLVERKSELLFIRFGG